MHGYKQDRVLVLKFFKIVLLSLNILMGRSAFSNMIAI